MVLAANQIEETHTQTQLFLVIAFETLIPNLEISSSSQIDKLFLFQTSPFNYPKQHNIGAIQSLQLQLSSVLAETENVINHQVGPVYWI